MRIVRWKIRLQASRFWHFSIWITEKMFIALWLFWFLYRVATTIDCFEPIFGFLYAILVLNLSVWTINAVLDNPYPYYGIEKVWINQNKKGYGSMKTSLMVHTVCLPPGINFEWFPGLQYAVLWSDAFDPKLTFSLNFFQFIWTEIYIYMSVYLYFWPHCAELARKQGLCKCYILIEMIKSQRRGMEKACSNQIKITVQWRFFFIFTKKKKTLRRRQEMNKSCKPLFPLPISQIDLCSPCGVLTQLSEIINPNLKAMIELFVLTLLQKSLFSYIKQIWYKYILKDKNLFRISF